MRIFLSGPMGAGKTTAGRALASALGLRFVDLDEAIEARHGAIESIFAQRGEGGFRALEGELVRELIGEENLCLALGGGTVCVYETRKLLLQSGLLFTLLADVRTLSERVVRDQSDVEKTARPLLAGGDVASRLRTLLRERTDAYGECHASIDASAGTETVVRQLLARVQDRPIGVFLGRRSYSVDIGWGIRERRPEGFEVADQNTARYARRPHLLDAGEAHKELSAVEAIWDAALARGVDRAGRLIAVGGGVVGDLTGFAAATLLRGVEFGLVATSIIAMVDSSVGGKTGFNRAGGKNLVGAFHQPSFVYCDIETLQTLPDDEYRAGFAEVVKSAWLAGDDDVTFLESQADAIRQREKRAIEEAIRRSIALKAKVVGEDERERGQRAVLNLGHTLGHAFEAARGLGSLGHGDAVALGLVAAGQLAHARSAMTRESQQRLERLLEALGLPVDYEGRLGPELLPLLAADKKRQGGRVRFVVPGAPGEVGFAMLTPDEILTAASR